MSVNDNPLSKKRIPVLLLKKEGAILQRLIPNRHRITIGRRAFNDLIVDSPGVSGEHGVINRMPDHFCYEDLGSTNGSRINGERIDYGILQDGDVIQFGAHTLEFVMWDAEQIGLAEQADLIIPPPLDLKQPPVPLPGIAPATKPVALIRILNGGLAGKEWPLTRSLTTIGYPPRHIAVFMALPDAYVFAHIEGDAPTMVNGAVVTASHTLAEGDVIRMGEVEAIFFLDRWHAHRR